MAEPKNTVTVSEEWGEHVLDSGEHFAPRGTFAFLMLMFIGFALYWGYMWYLAVIVRGVGA